MVLLNFIYFCHLHRNYRLNADLPTDPLLEGHTHKNALSPAPDHDPWRVIVFTRKITHQKLMPNW
jgi:hypothetical protein